MQDLFGEVLSCAKEDAYGFLIRWARRHRREPFSPEDVIAAAAVAGIAFDNQRQWGSVFQQAARDGHIRRAGLFPRASSNHSMRPGWIGL
jgi:hypothetical protein